jgi:small subunit ribosomal protein S2
MSVPGIKIKPEEQELVFPVKKGTENIVPVQELIAGDETLQNPDYFQVHELFTVRDLFDARIHLGHKIGSMNPHMKPFIFGTRFDTTIFDLDKTAFHLRQALNFAAHIAYRRGIILFVTRSAPTMNLVEKTAMEIGEYAHTKDYDTKILTNSAAFFHGLTRLPDLIILLNTLDTVLAQHKIVSDAAKMLIPTIGIVDSNCEPNQITYPVPGNDDTPCAVEFYCKVFKEAILRGKNRRKLNDNRVSKPSETKE